MPDPNGDGRAQCVAGNTIYDDDGSSSPVPPPNEVSTPSPDYARQTFTFYPIGGNDTDSLCGTAPGPSGGSDGTPKPPTGTGTGSYPTGGYYTGGYPNPTSVYSGTVSPTGNASPSGSGSPGSGSGSGGNGTVIVAPSTPAPVPFTGVASVQVVGMGLLAFINGVVVFMVS